MQGDLDRRREIGGGVADLIGGRGAEEELEGSEIGRGRKLKESGPTEDHETDPVAGGHRRELPGELLGTLEAGLSHIFRFHRAGEVEGDDDVAAGSRERRRVSSPLGSRERERQCQYTEASKPGAQPFSRNRGDRGSTGHEFRSGEVGEGLAPGARSATLQDEDQRRGQGNKQEHRVRENHGSRRSQVFSSAAPEQ
ncbi:MAG TPA: hypothetical protein VNM87_03680, partial [Candidatus Udaeobacter sp.]|nr:hypothetical protein [Candidatus Udaeobacter sp.]